MGNFYQTAQTNCELLLLTFFLFQLAEVWRKAQYVDAKMCQTRINRIATDD